MHQHGNGVERDIKTAIRYYKKATQIGNHPQAYAKCGDFFYSQNNKDNAMLCYQKAAEHGDVSSINSIALMLEQGYDSHLPDAEQAVLKYK
mgnify:CR=1 FL=1